MEKVKDKYLEEIAEIPEKVAISDETEVIKGEPALKEGNSADGLIIDAGSEEIDDSSLKSDTVNPVHGVGGLKSITTEFREKIKKSVPPDFDFSQIGKIDLKEAEKIANEEIIFLKEEDLIVGLEDFDLIPLKEVPDSWKQEAIQEVPEHPGVIVKRKEPETAIPPETPGLEEELLFEEFTSERAEAEKKPAGEISEEKSAALFEETVPQPAEPSSAEIVSEQIVSEKTLIVEDTPGETAEELSVQVEIVPEEVISEQALPEDSMAGQGEAGTEASVIKDEVILKSADSAGWESGEGIRHNVSEDVIDSQISEAVRDDYVGEDEILPQKYTELGKKLNVMFIDDGHLLKAHDTSIRTPDDPLTSRLSKIIEISRGGFRIIEDENNLLQNGYTVEDHGVYSYTDDAFYEERFMNDTDFEYIENSIIKEDFIQYIHEIDDYFYYTEVPESSEIAEIMGLSRDETEAFEDILFGDYFKDIDVDAGIEFINPDLDFFTRSMPEKKNLVYILDDPEGLKDEERKSIEDDVSSENAVIFEENIKEIELLLEESLEAQEAIPADQRILLSEEKQNIPDVTIIENITDKVIILEDKVNVEQFMETIPEKKEDLAKLLAYLDGLFEKLPEEAVKKFADSEYFDLYVKVMKEMGI